MLKRFSEVKDRFSIDQLDASLVDTSRWPAIDPDSLPEKSKEIYFVRVKAIHAYLNGQKVFNPEVSQREVLRLFKRCIKHHPDGRVYGFRALIPHYHIENYVRKSALINRREEQSGLSGAFSALLNQYQEIKDLIDREVFKKGSRNDVFESKVSIKTLHKKFLDRCKQLGLEVINAYPFNTSTRGYVSLAKYVIQIQASNAALAIKANQSLAAAKLTQTSDGSNRPVTRAYERVECDAHHLDAIFCILTPSPFGDLIPKIIRRLWVVVVEEVQSRAVLGYHLSVRRECNSADVLEAIKMSLSTWKPKTLTIPNLTYHDGAGFPSSHDPKLLGVLWNELSVDSALANTCDRVKSKLRVVSNGQSVPVVLNRHIPNDRPFIERFFETLERHGFHRLPNTTGTGINDPAKKNPELAAVKYQIQLEHLEQLLDVMIANYNSTPHTSIGQRTPLEYLQYLTATQALSYANSHEVESLLSMRKRVRISGSLKSGRRPFINFYGGTYTSDSLRANYSLCGKNIIVEADIKNLMLLRAYSEDGAEIGVLKAAPPWHLRPHSLELRKTLISLKEKKQIHYTKNSDPIAIYLTWIEAQLKDKKKQVPPLYLELRQSLVKELENESLVSYGKAPEQENEEVSRDTISEQLEKERSKMPPPKKATFRGSL